MLKITMKYFDTTPKDPQAVLEQLEEERARILNKIENPLGRLAARAVAHFGRGPLADNTWQTSYTKKKIF